MAGSVAAIILNVVFDFMEWNSDFSTRRGYFFEMEMGLNKY